MNKLNILLVMPKVDIGYQDWPVPPVGITYVSAALKQAGFPVFNVNMNLETDSIYDVLKREIEKNDIRMVATGGLVVNYHIIKEIIDTVKKVNPHIVTCIGGSLVTFSPEAVMRGIVTADFGMIGEGEITGCELAKAIVESIEPKDYKKIKGLIIRTAENELYLTAPREEISDIDTIPWPDYDGFQYFTMIREFWNSEVSGIVSAPLTTSRSCPFRCTFCSKSGGEKYRQRSLDNIFKELDFLVTKYNVNRVLLNDELFANDYARISEFCNRMKNYKIQWFVSLRISKHITKELLELMKDSGCIQILYGLESGDDSVLKSMRKGITVAEIERVVHLTAEAGFQVRGNFIFGDPAETMETVQNTINFIEKNLDVFTSVALSPIILFPGSELYKQALRNGTIEDELRFIEEECPLRNVSSMSNDEYLEMVNNTLPRAKAKLNAVKMGKSGHDFDKDTVKNKYSFDYMCPLCGEEHKYLVSNTEVIMRTNQYSCSKCGNSFYVNITYEFSEMLYNYMEEICKKYKTALWGCGQNMSVINEYISRFKELQFDLIDTDIMKIGKKGIDARIIHSPEEMERLGIEFVIEMTSVRRLEILNRIYKEFPFVKYAYSMFDIPLCAEEYMEGELWFEKSGNKSLS